MAKASAKLMYSLAPNALPDLVGSYHGVFVSHETVELDRLAARTAKANPPLQATAVKAVLHATFAEAADIMADRLFRASMGWLVFEPAMSGSLPSANAAPGPENELYVAVRPQGTIRSILAGITPVRADATDVDAVLDAVGRLDGSAPGVIGATGTFLLTGRNISAYGEGESITVSTAGGAEIAATVTGDDGYGQRITATPSAPLPAGKAVVYLTTCGWNTPDGNPKRLSKKVTVVTDPAPPPTPIVDPPELERAYSAGENHPDGCVYPGFDFVLSGINLSGCAVYIGYAEEGSSYREVSVPDESCVVTDTMITIAAASIELEDGIEAVGVGGVLHFIVRRAADGASASYECEVQGE